MSEVHSNILPIHRMSERTICLRLTMLQCSKCTFAIEMYIFNFFFPSFVSGEYQFEICADMHFS